MDALFGPLASVLGASVDQIKLIFCLLVAYPLGSLFVRVPSSTPSLRHAFSVVVALLFFFPILNIYSAFFQLLAGILVTYYLVKYDKSKHMPWRVFYITMGHLLINHTIRALNSHSYETVEVTGPQMVLTMKLTTFAWNVYDGRRPTDELDKWQLAKRITQYPSLLAFLGYSFYFPGILVGPYLDFAEYTDLINETVFKQPSVKSQHNSGRMLPPGRKRAAYTRLLMGLAYLGAFVVLGPKFNYSVALKPEFRGKSFLRRFLLFQLFGPFERAKYYAIWTLTEGASILTGLGFTGFSPSNKPQWNGASNVIVSQIEFAPNFKVLLDSWNMKTNVWLRECVYKRVAPKGKKPGNRVTAVTFLTSAIWHGVAAGYYLTFFMGAIVTSIARLARQSFLPLFNTPSSPLSSYKPIYDMLCVLATISILNYAASSFIISTWSDSVEVWRALKWYGHVVLGFAGVMLWSGVGKNLKKVCGVSEVVSSKEKKGNGVATSTVPPVLDPLVSSAT